MVVLVVAVCLVCRRQRRLFRKHIGYRVDTSVLVLEPVVDELELAPEQLVRAHVALEQRAELATADWRCLFDSLLVNVRQQERRKGGATPLQIAERIGV